jgi:hypothetical protein
VTTTRTAGRGRPVLVVVFLLVAAVGIVGLRQISEFRDDEGPSDASTQVVVKVNQTGDVPASASTADLLWKVCAVTIPGESIKTSATRGFVRATLHPALGTQVQRRFVGCLQDLTLPEVLGSVASIKDIPARSG